MSVAPVPAARIVPIAGILALCLTPVAGSVQPGAPQPMMQWTFDAAHVDGNRVRSTAGPIDASVVGPVKPATDGPASLGGQRLGHAEIGVHLPGRLAQLRALHHRTHLRQQHGDQNHHDCNHDHQFGQRHAAARPSHCPTQNHVSCPQACDCEYCPPNCSRLRRGRCCRPDGRRLRRWRRTGCIESGCNESSACRPG